MSGTLFDAADQVLCLAVDPGMHETGWALVTEDRILDCGLIKCSGYAGNEGVIRQILNIQCELPEAWEGFDTEDLFAVVEGQHYQSREKRASNMLSLAQVAGGCIATCQEAGIETRILQPEKWTKGIKKEVRNRRAVQVYFKQSEQEIAAMAECSLADVNHVLDAAVMGRFAILEI